MTNQLVTIERFILEMEPDGASGDFTALLYDIALAAKMVAMQTRRAGLLDITPENIHQRTPVYVGNRDLVQAAERFIKPVP